MHFSVDFQVMEKLINFFLKKEVKLLMQVFFLIPLGSLYSFFKFLLLFEPIKAQCQMVIVANDLYH